MSHIHFREVIICLNCVTHSFELFLHIKTDKVLDKCGGKDGCEHMLLGLVVNDGTFFFGALNCFELSAHTVVAESDLKATKYRVAAPKNYHQSNSHHHLIKSTHIALKSKFTVFFNSCKAHQHVSSGDPDLVKSRPSIIFSVVAEFRAHVS